MRLKQGLIKMPPGADVVEFFRRDGSPPAPVAGPAPPVPRKEPTLGDLRDRYLETHARGTLEARTVEGIRRHFGHLVRILGEGFKVLEMTFAELQFYVD